MHEGFWILMWATLLDNECHGRGNAKELNEWIGPTRWMRKKFWFKFSNKTFPALLHAVNESLLPSVHRLATGVPLRLCSRSTGTHTVPLPLPVWCGEAPDLPRPALHGPPVRILLYRRSGQARSGCCRPRCERVLDCLWIFIAPHSCYSEISRKLGYQLTLECIVLRQ